MERNSHRIQFTAKINSIKARINGPKRENCIDPLKIPSKLPKPRFPQPIEKPDLSQINQKISKNHEVFLT